MYVRRETVTKFEISSLWFENFPILFHNAKPMAIAQGIDAVVNEATLLQEAGDLRVHGCERVSDVYLTPVYISQVTYVGASARIRRGYVHSRRKVNTNLSCTTYHHAHRRTYHYYYIFFCLFPEHAVPAVRGCGSCSPLRIAEGEYLSQYCTIKELNCVLHDTQEMTEEQLLALH